MNTIQTDPSYDFLYWQCRIRQQSVRQGDGRPTPGMCPNIIIDEDTQLGQLVVLIIKQSPEAITAQFQHMVKKTQDPIERWESAIHLLSSAYYQDPKGFSDKMTALLGPGSAVCEKLIEAGKCILNFEQNNQRFSIPCAVFDLQSDDSLYQATFWHNSLFNGIDKLTLKFTRILFRLQIKSLLHISMTQTRAVLVLANARLKPGYYPGLINYTL